MCRSKIQRNVWIALLLSGLPCAVPTQLASAQGAAPETVLVQQAWQTLVDSAQERLRSTEGETSAARAVLQDLERFANRYPETKQAAIALFNAAALAARIGDYDGAERTLKAARGHTQDPTFLQSINLEMARLSVRVGKSAPALAVDEWVRGTPITLDRLKGKVVLLDIFQIICPGCHAAHPEIVRMQKRYKDRGFEVLGLAVAFELHYAQTPEKIRRYVDQKAYPYPVALDRGLIETFRRYGARGTPYTVLIDRQGRIRYLDFFRLQTVESTIRRLLGEDAPT